MNYSKANTYFFKYSNAMRGILSNVHFPVEARGPVAVNRCSGIDRILCCLIHLNK